MLQEHNTVVKICRICLTQGRRVSSLCCVKAGFPDFRRSWESGVSRLLLAAGIVLTVGACAAIERAEADEAKAIVAERAQKRVDLVIKGQLDQAYEFYSPASRATLSYEVFRKRSAGTRWWRGFKLDKVDCRPDACQVTMSLEYDLFELKGLKRTVEETWVKDGGNWWLVAGK